MFICITASLLSDVVNCHEEPQQIEECRWWAFKPTTKQAYDWLRTQFPTKIVYNVKVTEHEDN